MVSLRDTHECSIMDNISNNESKLNENEKLPLFCHSWL